MFYKNSLLGFPKKEQAEQKWKFHRFPFGSILGFGSGTYHECYYKDLGDRLIVRGLIEVAAANTNEVRIPLPPNYRTPPRTFNNQYLGDNRIIVGKGDYPSANGNQMTLAMNTNSTYMVTLIFSGTGWPSPIVGTGFGTGRFTYNVEIPLKNNV